MGFLRNANSFKDMYLLKKYDLHQLLGDIDNEWSLKINQKYRLTFYLCDDEENIIKNVDWLHIASTIKIVMIKEVSNHYAKRNRI